MKLKLIRILLVILQLDIIHNTTTVPTSQVYYNGHQLWRIGNFSKLLSNTEKLKIKNLFEIELDGLIWKDNIQYFDISFDKIYKKNAQNLLKQYNLVEEIMIDDIQSVINKQNQSIINEFSSLRTAAINGNEINWQSYQDLKTINRFLYTMEKLYPKRVKIFEIGRTHEGRILKVLRISDDPKNFDRIWIDGGIHAREWISPSALTYVIYTMLLNWDKMPYHVKTITWLFQPIVNPDGYDYTWKYDRLWYKNRRKNLQRIQNTTSILNLEKCTGVDLNRNFNINWKSTNQNFHPCKPNYAGADIFSESETQCMRDFLYQRYTNLKGYLTFHSYGQLIKYPYASTSIHNSDVMELRRGALKMAMKVNSMQNYGRKNSKRNIYSIQPAYQPYQKSGTALDWMKIFLNIPYVYQIELRDRGKNGFLLPQNEIIPTGKEAMEIIIAFSDIIYQNT